MKILIGYDGSNDAELAIDDLSRCGLPPDGFATVISIAEVWLPPPGSLDAGGDGDASAYVEEILSDCRQKGDRAVAEAEMLAKFAAGRVRTALPGWDVDAVSSYGSPGWEIIGEAERAETDLIVVGAQGQSFLSRLILGSISQRVLAEAPCSVRIARGRIDLDAGPQRIIVAFDNTKGANAAVAKVAERNWSNGTEIKVVAVTGPVVPASIARFVTPASTIKEASLAEYTLVEGAGLSAVETLRAAGLDATFQVLPGNPKQVLPEEAMKWGADCIFLGANAWGSRLARSLIGSTSAAVAARAHCSVEVVRARLSSHSPNQRPPVLNGGI